MTNKIESLDIEQIGALLQGHAGLDVTIADNNTEVFGKLNAFCLAVIVRPEGGTKCALAVYGSGNCDHIAQFQAAINEWAATESQNETEGGNHD